MPPELYPPELTSLSERTLGEVLAVVPEAILIGGRGPSDACRSPSAFLRRRSGGRQV